jgi:hypothetical protein
MIIGMILASAVVATILFCSREDHSGRVAEISMKGSELFLSTGMLGPKLKFRTITLKSEPKAEPEPKTQNKTTAHFSTNQGDRQLTNDVVNHQGKMQKNSGSFFLQL